MVSIKAFPCNLFLEWNAYFWLRAPGFTSFPGNPQIRPFCGPSPSRSRGCSSWRESAGRRPPERCVQLPWWWCRHAPRYNKQATGSACTRQSACSGAPQVVWPQPSPHRWKPQTRSSGIRNIRTDNFLKHIYENRFLYNPHGDWATPGGTALLSQSMAIYLANVF